MPALAMILTAAMMIPRDVLEKVSGEVLEEPQRLDLSGKWDMSVYSANKELFIIILHRVKPR